MNNQPSVLLMGTKAGAVIALEKLIESNFFIKGVVVPADYDSSWQSKPTLEERAKQNGIPVYFGQADVPLEKVDYVISYMYRHLVKDKLLKLAQKGAINFHPAPLPEFGGFAFYNLAIIEESPFYGCSCHHMDSSFDTGDIVKVRTFGINPGVETAYSLERKTQVEMLKLFDDVIHFIKNDNELPSIPQDKTRHRYLTRHEFEALKVISKSMSNSEIQKFARAFWYPPYTSAIMLSEANEKVSIVPECVLKELALLLHRKDFEYLRASI